MPALLLERACNNQLDVVDDDDDDVDVDVDVDVVLLL
jgi:hypothetical protein